VARLAAEQGIAVSVVAMTSPESLDGDAATAYMDFVALGGAVAEYEGMLDEEADLLIDGLLGSGLERSVEGRFAEVVDAINAHAASVVALDIPSGLHGDDGKVLGTAVAADLTITFVGLKTGLFLDNGPKLVGELRFAGLEIPARCREAQKTEMRRLDADLIRQELPRRSRASHKGDFGHVLVIGGGPGMPGAVRLCGEAALRAGAGLVSIATHSSHAGLIAAGRPELMCHGMDSAGDLEPLLAKATVIALGPGLGKTEWSQAMFNAAIDAELPLVVDADALNILAGANQQRDDWVLTPHPGEAARMLDSDTKAIQADRLDAVSKLQERFGGVAVLKGSGTLVSAGGTEPWLCSAGNPGMATAGAGDVLTGIIAALRAQGLDAEAAASAGVQIHAMAGDRAAIAGERGLIASDLLAEIHACVHP
jgi:NAD(P)H-hydrate epimerase